MNEFSTALEKSRSDSMRIRTYANIIEKLTQTLSYIRYPSNIEHNFQDEKNSNYYGFITNDMEDLIDNLLKIKYYMTGDYDIRPLKFLDVGCGMGNIMIAASVIGFDVYGIEYDEKTFNIASDYLPRIIHNYTDDGTKLIEKTDMVTYDKYGEFDVIYYFLPARKHDIMMQAAVNIRKGMKSGSIVIPYYFDHPFDNNEEFRNSEEFFGFIKK